MDPWLLLVVELDKVYHWIRCRLLKHKLVVRYIPVDNRLHERFFKNEGATTLPYLKQEGHALVEIDDLLIYDPHESAAVVRSVCVQACCLQVVKLM